MLALQILLAILLLAVCGFAPGFIFIRHLRWNPMEKLCGSIGVSFTLLYLVSAGLYDFSPKDADIRPRYMGLVFVACLGLGFAARRDALLLIRSPRVRRALGGCLFLLVWTFLILGVIRNYSGANWFGDWLEHFQRSLFFLHHFPTDTPILLGYRLPSRPPAMNEIAALFLGQTRDRFEVFQALFAFLNLLMFLPCCLIMPRLAGPRRTFILPLTALFAMNPVVMESVTYTWTKAFTAFYVVLAVGFYLAGWRKNDLSRMTMAFAALSMGLLVHYSAAPYLLFLTLHYLLHVFWKRPQRAREVATIAVVCLALLATWFGWSASVYGTHTTITSGQRYVGNSLERVANNLFDSFVPVTLGNGFVADALSQQGLAGATRDKAFAFYQTNLIFGMGLIGGPLVVWLVHRALFRRRSQCSAECWFWRVMIPFCIVAGVAFVGERAFQGVAQIMLLPMGILGLSLLAATFPWRRTLLLLVVAGCVFDFSFGILLQEHIESLENTSRQVVFPGLTLEGGKRADVAETKDSLSGVAWDNWYLKHQYALNMEELAQLSHDHPVDAAVGRAQMQAALRDDEVYWHGWYARNGGSVTFLGDHAASEPGWKAPLLTIGLVMLMVGLVSLMLKRGAAGRL